MKIHIFQMNKILSVSISSNVIIDTTVRSVEYSEEKNEEQSVGELDLQQEKEAMLSSIKSGTASLTHNTCMTSNVILYKHYRKHINLKCIEQSFNRLYI